MKNFRYAGFKTSIAEEGMIKVDEKENIRRLFFIKRYSVRRIAREYHYSRKTVRKAIQDSAIPEYHLARPKPYRVMAPYLPIIQNWLAEDKARPEKQRHTATRIYARLVKEHGFTGGERTVQEHVRRLKQDLSELAIPLDFDPGIDAQCDWGEAEIYLKGELVTANYFCLKLCYSAKPFVMAFPTQRQEAFFEGHKQAFQWFEGVPARIGYDNLKTAVLKVLRGRNRIEQEAFTAFRSHYLFESRFAMPATPREQGKVESLVGYSRRNYFVPIPRVDSFEELNQLLRERLREDEAMAAPNRGKTVAEAWTEEKSRLLPLPRFPHRCCTSRSVGANRYCLVNFDNNRYSVPVEYGLRDKLTLHAYVWKVEIACGERIIATHKRSYDKDKDILEVEHYLPLLIKRPGAFPYARPIRQWQMPQIYRQFLEALSGRGQGEGIREFLQILSLGRAYGREQLEEAMQQALLERQIDSQRIRQLLVKEIGQDVPAVEEAARLNQPRVILPDLSQYDKLRPVLRPQDGQGAGIDGK
jgi:transposase